LSVDNFKVKISLLGNNHAIKETGGITMIGPTVEKYLLENKESYLIPAKNVANLSVNNPLTHALLVLSQVHYTKIPVLDVGDRFVGLLSLADVVEKMVEQEIADMDNLRSFTVADVMEVGVATVSEDWSMEEVLHKLIDVTFLPVVDEENCFKGIITRKVVLKAVNYTAHMIEKENYIMKRVEDFETDPKNQTLTAI
jgi:predicted transcriptional regulator